MAEIIIDTPKVQKLVLEQKGKSDHSKLKNLGFEESGHKGFQAALTEEQLKNISDVPGKASNKYIDEKTGFELVDSATLTENVSLVVFDLKGNKYKELYFYFNVPTNNADGSNTTKARFYLYNANRVLQTKELWNNQSFLVENYTKNWHLKGTVKAYGTRCDSQLWWNRYAGTAYAQVPEVGNYSGGMALGVSLTNPYIDALCLYFLSQTAGERVLPAGTTYELWGVRV